MFALSKDDGIPKWFWSSKKKNKGKEKTYQIWLSCDRMLNVK